MRISEPTASDDGYVHFNVSTEAGVVDVCLNPHGIYSANESQVGERVARDARHAVTDWTAQNEDQLRQLFAVAGRLFRSKEPRLREHPLPRLPILSAARRNHGIDVVVHAGSIDIRYHVSWTASIIEVDDIVDLVTRDEIDAAVDSVARYLVEDDRLIALGGDATLKQLLQDFWIFEAREPGLSGEGAPVPTSGQEPSDEGDADLK